MDASSLLIRENITFTVLDAPICMPYTMNSWETIIVAIEMHWVTLHALWYGRFSSEWHQTHWFRPATLNAAWGDLFNTPTVAPLGILTNFQMKLSMKLQFFPPLMTSSKGGMHHNQRRNSPSACIWSAFPVHSVIFLRIITFKVIIDALSKLYA